MKHSSKSKNIPKISIITPSYNLGNYLETAIQSVLSQDYQNFEYFVIDGGSTDNTLEILKKYESVDKYKDRFSWISESDSGQTNAINKGLKMTNGKWFAWLNADDYYEPGAFSAVAKTISHHPDSSLIYGNCLTHGDTLELNIPESGITYDTFSIGNPIYGPSAFFKKKTVEELGGFDEDLFLWMDYDMFMRIAKNHKIKYVDQLLAHFIQRDGQKSRSHSSQLQKEVKYVKYKNKYPRFKKIFKMKYGI